MKRKPMVGEWKLYTHGLDNFAGLLRYNGRAWTAINNQFIFGINEVSLMRDLTRRHNADLRRAARQGKPNVGVGP